MRKPRKKTENWAQRRVCFVISDAYHKLTMANITMPVRVKERTDSGLTIYEGPIETMWEKHVAPRYNTGRIAKALSIYSHDLVGVLVASTESMNEGSITWVVQSEATNPKEAGADLIKGEGSMRYEIDIDIEGYIDDISDELIVSEYERRCLASDHVLMGTMADAYEELLRGRPAEARLILERVLYPKWSSKDECERAYNVNQP